MTLLEQVMRYKLDDPNSKMTFSDRLAKENMWTKEYTLRVIDEYKRFCYLATTLKHPVSPSEDVDQAWHLHLLYTQDYWDVFCKDVLRFRLHHGPTKGGKEEGKKFVNMYELTMCAYEKVFKQPAPKDIWPDPADRFAVNMVRVDLSTHIVIDTKTYPRFSRICRKVLSFL